jgi:hypothetical protein
VVPVSEILDAMKDVAQANPEQAKQFVADLKARFDSLSPEQKEQAIAKLQELRDKIADLPEDQKAEIASLIREKGGV